MPSEPTDPRAAIEARATAFVFGELSRDEAIEFMHAMSDSPELRATVTSIRDAVGAVKAEFETNTTGLNDLHRQRIEAAIGQPEPPPVVMFGPDRSTRHWVLALAVAATLLLASGLTLPALNRVITANTDTEALRQRLKEIESENQRLAEEKRAIEAELAAAHSSSTGITPKPEVSNDDDPPPASRPLDNDNAMSVGTEDANRRNLDPQRIATPVSPLPLVPDLTIEHSETLGDRTAEAVARSSDDPNVFAANDPATSASDTDNDTNSIASNDEPLTVEKLNHPKIAAGGYAMRVILGQLIPSRTRHLSQPNQAIAGDARELDDPALGDAGGATDLTMIDAAAGGTGQAGTGQTEAGLGGASIGGTGRRLEGSDDLERSALGGLDATRGDPFRPILDNPFLPAMTSPLSGFAVDIAKDAYTNVRTQLLRYKQLPSPDTVRIEELVNFFDYGYAPPANDQTFAAALEVAGCPWNPEHRLARIGIQAKKGDDGRPPSNLVFLLDVSGSMNRPNKMPVLIQGMKLLFDQLDQRDSIAIVVYAGATGLVLDSTPGDRKKVIFDSLNRLRSGGPTNRGRGIQLAYKIAQDHYIDGGTNRVILCNDGDFNVGVAGIDQLAQLAKENAAQNIFLTVLGFGSDRPDNVILEQISGHGHGNYVFIEHEEDARQVLLKQVQTSLKTIARDVKLEVEFNPMEVESYRLIGFENLFLSGEDVFDITIDGEDIDAGHSVTALYEIVPKRRVQRADLAGDLAGDSIGGVPGQDSSPGRDRTPMENLKYQQQIVLSDQAASGEMLSVKLRYLPPAGDQNVQIEFSVKDSGKEFIRADRDFQFAASVAAFGMLLRHSPHKGNSDLDLVEMLASTGAIDDRSGYREEFLSLVKRARMIGSW